MRIGLGAGVGVAAVVIAAGCGSGNETTSTGTALANPDSLTYTVVPSVPGSSEGGVLLQWSPAPDSRVVAYAIYSRPSITGTWGQIAETILYGFYDEETPSLQYYVASEDEYGDLSTGTAPITIDTLALLAAPASVTASPFDSAAVVTWAAVASTDSTALSYYNVYAEPSVADTCTTGYTSGTAVIEGSTNLSTGFVVTGLPNGVTACFAVTAVSTTGQESYISSWASVTPTDTSSALAAIGPTPFKTVAHGSERPTQVAHIMAYGGAHVPRR
jgi:hypothetical protein